MGGFGLELGIVFGNMNFLGQHLRPGSCFPVLVIVDDVSVIIAMLLLGCHCVIVVFVPCGGLKTWQKLSAPTNRLAIPTQPIRE